MRRVLGPECKLCRQFAIDFHVRYTTAKIEGIRNNLAALVGFDSYDHRQESPYQVAAA